MFFTLPWMLVGLVGLPTVAAIYWLHSRARPRTVSSLFLWQDQRRPRQGGRVIQKLQTPLLFFLELLAIASLALAAAAPALTHSRYARPLVVVLDDSFSMLAGGPDSSRSRGLQRLQQELRSTSYAARLVLAGTQPKLLSPVVRTPDELTAACQEWNCSSPISGLEAAIALASEMGGGNARVLVVSDHAPTAEISPGRIEWWSFGKPLDNTAFTAALRNENTDGEKGAEDRMLLEISNFGQKTARTELILEGGNLPGKTRRPLELKSGESSRIILNLPNGSAEIRAKLSDDSLKFDNDVVLVSPREKPLRVQLAVSDHGNANPSQQSIWERAFHACRQAILVDSRPDLLVTDNPQPAQTALRQLVIRQGPDSVSYDGPFVLDRSHPLTQGLSLDAVIWSAPRDIQLTGTPVVAAGNRVLLAESVDLQGRFQIEMVFDPELSNLTETPDWPILVANLVRWCRNGMPGASEWNLRLGQPVQMTFPPADPALTTAQLTAPDKKVTTISVRGNQLTVQPEQTGLYSVQAGSTQYQFASNPISADESNLKDCVTGRWGNWEESDQFQSQRLNLDWALILIALVCLATRTALISRTAVGGT